MPACSAPPPDLTGLPAPSPLRFLPLEVGAWPARARVCECGGPGLPFIPSPSRPSSATAHPLNPPTHTPHTPPTPARGPCRAPWPPPLPPPPQPDPSSHHEELVVALAVQHHARAEAPALLVARPARVVRLVEVHGQVVADGAAGRAGAGAVGLVDVPGGHVHPEVVGGEVFEAAPLAAQPARAAAEPADASEHLGEVVRKAGHLLRAGSEAGGVGMYVPVCLATAVGGD